MTATTSARPTVTAPSGADGPPTAPPLRSGTWPRQVRVEITQIRNRMTIALVGRQDERRLAVAAAIERHLEQAEDVIRAKRWYLRPVPVDWWRGTSIEQAYRSLHAARVFLVELSSDDQVGALVPGVVARVQSCLPATDPQRQEVEKLPGMRNGETKRAELIHALELGYAASDESYTRVRRFRNVLLCAAALIAVFTAGFVLMVARAPSAVPLCFEPAVTTAEAATVPPEQRAAIDDRAVCPSGEEVVGEVRPPSGADVWIVAGLGLLGGALASAVSVRKMGGSSTPYDVPVALALLKVPSGALTAVAGILLLGGGFVPGFSELDSQRQILAYALVFGYAQQLATRYLDDRATTLLADVPSKHSPPAQTRSIPPAPVPEQPANPTTNGTGQPTS